MVSKKKLNIYRNYGKISKTLLIIQEIRYGEKYNDITHAILLVVLAFIFPKLQTINYR